MPSKNAHLQPRIVFDTNALISAAMLPSSLTKKSFDLAVEHFQLVVTESTWNEFLTRIKRQHFARYFETTQYLDTVIFTFSRFVEHVESTSIVMDCRDSDDNQFLALALDSGAKIMVSGDKELLVLHPWREIDILTPGDFYRIYSAQ